ncbi:MAG: hypothetical protein LC659_00965, partial [Myxococcales bacterium]|nr:hypothetical protein [Myxococcales bacterium]
MKPNINDLSNLQDLKRVLADRNVSPATIDTLEKTLKGGMSFRRPEDVSLLNIATADLGVLTDAVDFGPAAGSASNVKRVEYRFEPLGDAKAFFGYNFLVRSVNGAGFTVEESYPIDDDRTVVVDYDLATLMPGSVVTLHANSAEGSRAKIKAHDSSDGAGEFVAVEIPKLANAVIDVAVASRSHVPNPSVHATYPVRGKLISNKGSDALDGYQVVLFAAVGAAGGTAPAVFAPVATARTETNGYFVTSPLLFDASDDLTRVAAVKAVVSKADFSTDIAITPVVVKGNDAGTPSTSMIPERVLLVITEAAAANDATATAECGCNDLNFHEKKVLEEHSYYTVVRTSEPAIIADVLEDEKDVDLQDIYGVRGTVPFSVFKKFHDIQSRQIDSGNFRSAPAAALSPSALLARSATTALVTAGASLAPPEPVRAPAFNQELLDKLLVEHKANLVIKGKDNPVFKGRAYLSETNQIDWDDTPTIYQAVSIAHGHLLHFKQEWAPDGYSIGDIVYSLPLAPGQKKQIAVLDWERRESAANSQSLDYEETLNNSLARDRDINEIVSGTLTENIRANSKARTSGIGFGLGSSVMGIIPGVGTFGSLLGISGGTSSSGSDASQSSSRDSTANSLQMIMDRTQQAASVVRSQRASVVQAVSQGERVQATAESVANYNHCHAITIQYFEVLRHFAIRNRLADVQECLFVPLRMTPFDLDKCLRWRGCIEKHLLRRDLAGAFDAVVRIENEKQSPFENYYDSIGYPRKNFAEQAINALTGELFFEFFFFNTNEKKVDDAIVAFYSLFGISLDAYRDKAITDDDLAKHVGPRAIEYLLDAFTIETDKGVNLQLDLTLLSTFQQNRSLRVSVRQSAGTPVTVPRDQIAALNIKLDLSRLSADEAKNLSQFQNRYLKVRLRSGNLRYRTDNFAGSLFDGRIENDIFAGSDGAYITTPLTRDELRNPRGEDVNAANNLMHHLNENLEYYNKCIFLDMTPERRFM